MKVLHLTTLQLLLLFAFASADFLSYTLCGFYAIFYFFKYPFNRLNKRVAYWVIISFFTGLIFMPLNLSGDVFIIPKFLTGFFGLTLTLSMLGDKATVLASARNTVFVYQVLVLCAIVYFGFNDFPRVSPLEKVFPGKSGNGITSYLILIQTAYFFLHVQNSDSRKGSLLLSLIITFLITLSTYARGSLISAFLLLVTFYSLYSFSIRFWCILLVCVLMLSTLFYSDIELFFLRYTKLSHGFSGDERVVAMNEYMDKLDIITFFTGADYHDTIINDKLNGNPHNSFIRGHHNFGIFYIINVLLLMFIPVSIERQRSKRLIYFVLSIILLFRMWTEPILSPTILDYFFYMIYFSLLTRSKKVYYETNMC